MWEILEYQGRKALYLGSKVTLDLQVCRVPQVRRENLDREDSEAETGIMGAKDGLAQKVSVCVCVCVCVRASIFVKV
ncbi:hypothetical protein JZ751_025747 [Albula glossodonta]|uniref:Uncharacterized protein n=1 Tax=Albula glossodonta TaxID=121402 RepID=A0A8T2NLJ8_9TELE|nr:hypothetical protein JZ751_025747 [Albula glossodonta]